MFESEWGHEHTQALYILTLGPVDLLRTGDALNHHNAGLLAWPFSGFTSH